MTLSASGNDQKYELDLEVFAEISKDESKWNTKGRNTLVCLAKKDKN